jgi:hypothetical protein
MIIYHLHRVLTTGVQQISIGKSQPGISVVPLPSAISLLPSVSQHKELMQKVTLYHLRDGFVPAQHMHTPQNVKQGKKPRRIWDGTTWQFCWD